MKELWKNYRNFGFKHVQTQHFDANYGPDLTWKKSGVQSLQRPPAGWFALLASEGSDWNSETRWNDGWTTYDYDKSNGRSPNLIWYHHPISNNYNMLYHVISHQIDATSIRKTAFRSSAAAPPAAPQSPPPPRWPVPAPAGRPGAARRRHSWELKHRWKVVTFSPSCFWCCFQFRQIMFVY